MAKLLKLRRGDNTAHSTFTGAEGEVTVNTQKDTIVVHDGSTQGGFELARADLSNLPAGTIDNADISSSAAIANSKLATSGVSAGTYGSSSAIPAITVNDRGIVTAASTTAIDSTAIANGTTNVTAETNRIDFHVSGIRHAFADATGLFLRNQYDLKFGDANSSHYVGFQAPTTVNSSLTWTLPAADGSDRQALTTNGSNVLGWTNLPAITSSSSAPSNPKDNDLWYDTDDGRLYFRYNDGTSTQWVDASPEGGPGSNEFNSVRLNGSTSGWIQLEAPAVAPSSTIVFPATSGTNGAYLQTNGAGVTSWQTITENTSVLERGTSVALSNQNEVTFTGIPSTARRVVMDICNMSTNGNDEILFRLGAGAAPVTSGYHCAATRIYSANSCNTYLHTNGFGINWGDSSSVYSGRIVIENVNGNNWVCQGFYAIIQGSSYYVNFHTGGHLSLNATLDRVQLLCEGSNVFDQGVLNIMWETE